MTLKRTIQPPNKTKDPYCMMILRVIEMQAKLARKGSKSAIEWFDSEDYRLYIDVVSQLMDIDIPYDMKPDGI